MVERGRPCLTCSQITGPIPVASYMRQCLTSDLGGYYTAAANAERDQFGAKGDFVTSPEISQVFGEVIGVWVVAEWMAQGKKSEGVYLMEVGPGRGTLMDDMLRVRDMSFTTDIRLRFPSHCLLADDSQFSATGQGHRGGVSGGSQ